MQTKSISILNQKFIENLIKLSNQVKENTKLYHIKQQYNRSKSNISNMPLLKPIPTFDVRKAGLSPNWLWHAPRYGQVILEPNQYLHERILYRILNTTGENNSNLTDPDANTSSSEATSSHNVNGNYTTNITNVTMIIVPTPSPITASPSPSFNISNRTNVNNPTSPSIALSLLQFLLSFPFYYYIIVGVVFILLILLGRYLKRKIYDKGYICYYKYCHKVKGSDEIHIETPRFNDEVHVEIVPDVMIKINGIHRQMFVTIAKKH